MDCGAVQDNLRAWRNKCPGKINGFNVFGRKAATKKRKGGWKLADNKRSGRWAGIAREVQFWGQKGRFGGEKGRKMGMKAGMKPKGRLKGNFFCYFFLRISFAWTRDDRLNSWLDLKSLGLILWLAHVNYCLLMTSCWLILSLICFFNIYSLTIINYFTF